MKPSGLTYLLVVAGLLVGCGGGGSSAGSATASGGVSATASTTKPYPTGVYASVGGARSTTHDMIGNYTAGGVLDGVLISVPWNLCDQACLLDFVEQQLAKAETRGLKIALIVGDGMSAPDTLKAVCQTFAFDFRGTPQTLCLPWDAQYLAAKQQLVRELGARFDQRAGLAYVYFTGACSTNGNEGHCRVDKTAFVNAGYTNEKLTDAYRQIMGNYLAAFPTTPVAFEVHAIFDSAEPWATLWSEYKSTNRLGVAAWWCAERLSVNGAETTPVWPLVQDAAGHSFTVCQTVANLTNEPYRFSDALLGLDYGTETQWDTTDSMRAFNDHMDWIAGLATHAGQTAPVRKFSVMEGWTADVANPAFAMRLRSF